jgi:uncharacterized protein YbjT (DUF2867 family)
MHDPAQAIGPIGVMGGAGRAGRLVLARLAARGVPCVALVRDPRAAQGLGPGIALRATASLEPESLAAALAGLSAVACCAPVAVVPALAAAMTDPAVRLVALGSTRRFTRFADPAAEGVRAAEAAVLARGGASLILHPTMIYGGRGENNVLRVAALIRRLGVLPLPGGGRSLIQPIHAEDVAACVDAALSAQPAVSGALVIAGPEPLTWAGFARAIADAAGLRVRILPVPLALARAAAAAARLVPGLPPVTPDELRRLLEDKAFDIAPMQRQLGIIPRPLADGLAEAFARTWRRT